MRFSVLHRKSVIRLLQLLFWLSSTVCANGQGLQVSFQASTTSGCAPLIVEFQNTSVGATGFSWQFGNGNTSTDPNPTNVFDQPGTYTVTLTANQGSNTSTHTATITVHPTPVADFMFNQSSGCQGADVFEFTNLSSGFDSCVWDFGDGIVSYQQHPIHVYDTSGVFTVKLLVINRQTGCQKLKIRSNCITVYPKPVGSVMPLDTQSCEAGHVFQFLLANTQQLSTWTWDFGNGSVNPNQSAVSFVFTDTGYHRPMAVLVSPLGCVDTVYSSVPVHLKYNPVPVVSAQYLSGCQPLRNTYSTVPVPNAVYSWDVGGGIIRPGSSVYYDYLDSGMYAVSLTAVYANGCVNTVNVGPVTVLGRPSFLYSMSNATGCAPLAVQFQNHSSAANYTWLWDFGDGDTSNAPVPAPHIYDRAGTYSISLTATNQNGCTWRYYLAQKVQVYGPEAGINADVVTGCPPLLVNFTNSTSFGNTYSWTFGDGGSSSAVHPSHVYDSSGTYTVQLIAVDTASGCSDTAVFNSQITTGPPVVNYQTPPAVTGCAPFGVNFSDASGAAAYLWDFGDGSTSSQPNPYHVFTGAGTYVVSLTTTSATNGCEYHIPNFQTFIIDAATPGFVYSVSQCPPYVVQFTDTSTNAVAWNWSFGSFGSSSQQNPTFTYPGPGIYSVTLHATTPGGCQTTLQANGAVQITGLGANPAMLCSDTTAPFNAQFYANSSNATWWYWSFGDGSTDSSENPLHVYNGTGPFHLSLTIGNDSCSYTYSYPPITFGSINSNSGGLGGVTPYVPLPRYCSPYTVNFTNPDPSAVGYSWHFGDGSTSNSASPSHTFFSGGIFIPVVHLTRPDGTVDTLVLGDTIIVNDPVTDFQISNTPLCLGMRVDVSSTVPGATYLWDFGGGITYSTPTATRIYPNVSATYQISLHTIDSNSCESYVVKSFRVSASGDLKSSTRRACAGDSISFDPGNQQFASYLWDFGDGTTSSAPSPVHAYSNRGSYQVILRVTDVNGCMRRYALPYLVHIYKPEAQFTMTGPQTNCQLFKYWFANQSQGSSAWVWYANGIPFSSDQNPNKIFSIPGSYDITLIASESICSDTFSLPGAFYLSQLSADFHYSLSGNCSPAAAQFTDMSVDAVSWHWSFGDGNTSISRNPGHVYHVQPTDSITLTVKDVNGCSKQKRLPAPVITKADFTFTATGGCAPWQVDFNNTSSNAQSIHWDFGNGAIDTLSSPSCMYSADGFYTVRLVVTGPTGCTDTLELDSLVEVNTPVAMFDADTLSGCAPLLVQYLDQSINAVTYAWDFGSGSGSNFSNPDKLYSDPGYYSTSLVVTNKFSCRDTLLLDSLVHVVGPEPAFVMSQSSGCSPLSVSFINQSNSSVAYQWYFGDGLTDTSMNTVHMYSDSGSFTVSLFAVDSIGCTSVFTHPVEVSVVASPRPGFYTDIVNGCAPLSITITDTSQFADSLVWDMGDGQLFSGPISMYTYQQPGVYKIKLKAFNGDSCSTEVTMQDSIVVGQRPIVDFMSSQTEGCPPFQAVLMSQCTQLDNPVYGWNFGNGTSGSGVIDSVLFDQSGSYTVTLVVTNSGGCMDSVTKSAFITVFDTLPPSPVVIRRVSVEPATVITLEWFPVNAIDVDYYAVYRYDPVGSDYDSIGFLPASACSGLPIATFIDQGVNTGLSSYTYKVIAVDKCGYSLPLNAIAPHTSVLLNASPGLHRVSLQWSSYGGCTPDFYSIWRFDAVTGNTVLIGQTDSVTLEFIDTTAWCPIDYSYRIEAAPLCGDPLNSSFSNFRVAKPQSTIQMQTVDVVRSTVVDDRYVLTEWLKPLVLPEAVMAYDIYRSDDGVNFNRLGSVPAGVHSYDDRSVDVDWNRYVYRISSRNVCELQPLDGRIGTSILLEKTEAGSIDYLKWTRYLDWDSGVERYVIQRMNEQGQWVDEKVLPPNITDWEVE